MTNTIRNLRDMLACAAAASIITLVFSRFDVPASPPVDWLEHEPALTIGVGKPTDERTQLGLRKDGVVVWRRGYIAGPAPIYFPTTPPTP